MDFFWAQHVLSVEDKVAETKIHFICFFSFSPYHSAHTGNHISSELLHLPLFFPLFFLVWYEAWIWNTFSHEKCVLLLLFLTCSYIFTHLYNTHTIPTWTCKDAVEDFKTAPSENTIWRGLLQDLTDLWTFKPKNDLFHTTFAANFRKPPRGGQAV